MTSETKIRPDSKWKHHSGRVYTVVAKAKHGTADSHKQPVVVYVGDSGVVWYKEPWRFLDTMTPVEPDNDQ